MSRFGVLALNWFLYHFYSQLGWLGRSILPMLSQRSGNPVLMPTSLKRCPIIWSAWVQVTNSSSLMWFLLCFVWLLCDWATAGKRRGLSDSHFLFFLKNGTTCFNNWSHFKLKRINADCPVEQAWTLSLTLIRCFYQTTDGQALFLTLLYWSLLCGHCSWREQGSMFARFSVLRGFTEAGLHSLNTTSASS